MFENIQVLRQALQLGSCFQIKENSHQPLLAASRFRFHFFKTAQPLQERDITQETDEPESTHQKPVTNQ